MLITMPCSPNVTKTCSCLYAPLLRTRLNRMWKSSLLRASLLVERLRRTGIEGGAGGGSGGDSMSRRRGDRLCPPMKLSFVLLSCVTATKLLPSERREPLEETSDLVANTDQPLAFGRPRPRLPHSSYVGVYGRAVLTLAAVVVAQTVGAASWMGPLAGPVLAWSSLRAEYVQQQGLNALAPGSPGFGCKGAHALQEPQRVPGGEPCSPT